MLNGSILYAFPEDPAGEILSVGDKEEFGTGVIVTGIGGELKGMLEELLLLMGFNSLPREANDAATEAGLEIGYGDVAAGATEVADEDGVDEGVGDKTGVVDGTVEASTAPPTPGCEDSSCAAARGECAGDDTGLSRHIICGLADLDELVVEFGTPLLLGVEL